MPARPVLFVQHVRWEAPHRIADVLSRRLPSQTLSPLAGDELPGPDSVAAAVFMGGPMGVDSAARLPGLAAELRWIEAALSLELPLLGICLGSQLIAHVLGAPVAPAQQLELGWLPVSVNPGTDPDPLLGPLAPVTTALHWHGEEFSLPPGAQPLAASELTSCQAFRFGNAWGVLFHPEADVALLHTWLAEPTMRAQASTALGEQASASLLAGADRHERELIARSNTGFEAFAALVLTRESG